MRKITKGFALFFLLLFLFQFVPIHVHGEEVDKNNIILLIDNSGSMDIKDKNRLAIVAASMLIDTLDEGTDVNIIGFGDKVLSPYVIRDKPSPKQLKELLQSINYTDGHTNLKDGLDEAIRQLNEVEGNKTIIILADGKEDLDGKGNAPASHMEELRGLADKAGNSGIKIHTIGFSEDADKETLNSIAFATSGNFFYCSNPAELFDIYGKAIGDINSFETIDKYTTGSDGEKDLEISSYIDEIIIKIASYESKTPYVNVLMDNKELLPENLGGSSYKVYKIKNDNKNISLKIQPRDKGRNMVIVQIKSKTKLELSSANDSFEIPCNIPMDIQPYLDIKEKVEGLHMDIAENGVPNLISETNGIFKLTILKDTPGQYQYLIKAYDGNNNIIAVKSMYVRVTDKPPFYYVGGFKLEPMTDYPQTISLKQLGGPSVTNPSGEIIVKYKDESKRFPLALKDGILSADVNLSKEGEANITARIQGNFNNDTFSYYLPYTRINIARRPFINIEMAKNSRIFKKGGMGTINLNINDSLIPKSEKISLKDKDGREIGSFTLEPNQKGKINVGVKPAQVNGELIISFSGEETLKLPEAINTGISIISPGKYFWRANAVIFISISILVLLGILAYIAGKRFYENYVETFIFSASIRYGVNTPFKPYTENVYLSLCEIQKFVNLNKNNISIDAQENNAIGYFILTVPEGATFFIGLKYVLSRYILKKSIFDVTYESILAQEISLNGEDKGQSVQYESGIEISLTNRKDKITIEFQY